MRKAFGPIALIAFGLASGGGLGWLAFASLPTASSWLRAIGATLIGLLPLVMFGRDLVLELRHDQRAQQSHSVSMDAAIRELMRERTRVTRELESGDAIGASVRDALTAEKTEIVAQLESRRAAKDLRSVAPRAAITDAGVPVDASRMAELKDLLARSGPATDELDAGGWFLRGNAAFHVGDINGALDSYEHSLQLAPMNRDTLMNKGAVLAASSRYADARLVFEQMLRQDPQDVKGLIGLGNVLANLGEHDAAIERHRRAVELEQSWQTLHSLGTSLGRRGTAEDLDEARQVFHRALEIAGKNPLAIGMITSNLRDIEQQQLEGGAPAT